MAHKNARGFTEKFAGFRKNYDIQAVIEEKAIVKRD